MLTIGTYNIMKPNQVGDRHNAAWPERKEQVLQNIGNVKADILCIQELAVPDQEWMRKRVAALGYALFYASCKEGSGIAVLYRQDKFDLVAHKEGIFSGDGGARRRSFVQVDLRDKQTQEITRAASMHLYGGTKDGNPLGRQQIESFRGQIEQETDQVARIVLAGDFNSDIQDERTQNLNGPCRYMLDPNPHSPFSYHSALESGIHTTNRSRRHLDWVFVGLKDANKTSETVSVTDVEVVPVPNEIVNASDHRLHALCLKGIKVLSRVTTVTSVASAPQNPLPAGLQTLLARQGHITRQDVADTLHMDRHAAQAKIENEWVQPDFLIRQGHGRDTIYVAGPRLPKQAQPAARETRKNTDQKITSLMERICHLVMQILEGIVAIMAHFRPASSSSRNHHSSSSHRPRRPRRV